ncbi:MULTISPECIES: MFS transporter [Enterococcus]|uniref:MFS transporter n=1 Tax=Enterococcus alishanensis TaxID=1303817 RepID=A0ABS6TGR5_9ENTE|nr:MFS transporter [Enterococcus alishanensis]MBV7392010.1 MFS transporter [Enterococcus alishanensis]
MNYKKYTYLLATGHLFADFTQGAVAALLPFLIAEHHYAYAVAAGLIFAMNLVSSIIQPLFGFLSDKYRTTWILPVAVLLVGIGFSLLGIANSYNALIFWVTICGIGIAAYHPDAAKLTNTLSLTKKGQGMSIFTFGGNIGFAIGPITATALVNLWGIRGVLVVLIPTAILTLIFTLTLPKLNRIAEEFTFSGSVSTEPKEKDDWKMFGVLTVVLIGRSIAFYGLNTFLALYWVNTLQQSTSSGSFALSLMFIVGATGTLIGGRLADYYGHKKIIVWSFLAVPLLLFALGMTRNVALAFILVVPIGLLLFIPYSSMVILGQKYLPNKMGLASGVTLGLAVSVGGITSPILGKIADVSSLSMVIFVLAAVMIPAVICSFLLKDKK